MRMAASIERETDIAAREADSILARAGALLPGSGPVVDARTQAFGEFSKRGLPNRRVEEWKYTDLRALLGNVLSSVSAPDDAALALAGAWLDEHAQEFPARLVLVDGYFIPSLSHAGDVAGLQVLSLRDVLENTANQARGDLLQNAIDDPIIALNAAMASDGIIVNVADGAVLDRPIHILHLGTQSDTASFSRSFLKMGAGARASIVETYAGLAGAANQAFDTMIVWMNDGAELNHVRLVQDAPDTVRVSSAGFTLHEKSRLNVFNLATGGRVSRYQAFARFVGEGAHADICGAHLLRGNQHADMTLVLDHVAPHCTSRESFRAVLDDQSRSVFQGKIVVQAEAQKTDAQMMTRALLLSDDAEMDNKPELEIYADDVACGHGATCGGLDEDLLFYLRARGLPQAEAQALLVQAFVGDVIEAVPDEALREMLAFQATRWLGAIAS